MGMEMDGEGAGNKGRIVRGEGRGKRGGRLEISCGRGFSRWREGDGGGGREKCSQVFVQIMTKSPAISVVLPFNGTATQIRTPADRLQAKTKDLITTAT